MTFNPLKPGDTIGVFAPSSCLKKSDIEKPVSFIQSLGYNVFVHPQSFEVFYQSAGTSQQKVSALTDLYTKPEIKAIIAARGGNRGLHILPEIEFDLLKKYPKPLIGYSDMTPLLHAVWGKTGHFQVHGPVLRELGDHENAEKLFDLLSTGKFDYNMKDAVLLKEGHAKGQLFGGNLTLLHHMIGMPYMPDLKGAILFLEDVSEELSRLDRTLCHFKQLGIFDHLAGLVFGSFSDLKDSGNTSFGFSLQDIITEHTQHLNIPIVMNAPFGHDTKNYALPIGQNVQLSVTSNNIQMHSVG